MGRFGITLGVLLVFSLFVAGVSTAGAEEGKKKKKAGTYSGEATELDLNSKRMVVAQNNTDLAMVFNTGRAKVGSGYKDMGEVKVGDQVVVKFEAKVGTIYALTVARGEKNEAVKPAASFTHPPHPAAK